MKASYGRQSFLFNAAEKTGLENSMKIILPISTSTINFKNLWLETHVFVFVL